MVRRNEKCEDRGVVMVNKVDGGKRGKAVDSKGQRKKEGGDKGREKRKGKRWRRRKEGN